MLFNLSALHVATLLFFLCWMCCQFCAECTEFYNATAFEALAQVFNQSAQKWQYWSWRHFRLSLAVGIQGQKGVSLLIWWTTFHGSDASSVKNFVYKLFYRPTSLPPSISHDKRDPNRTCNTPDLLPRWMLACQFIARPASQNMFMKKRYLCRNSDCCRRDWAERKAWE